MLYILIATAQKAGAVCAYIDTKNAADVQAMKAAGITLADLLVSQPDSAERGLEIATKLAAAGVEVIVINTYLANAARVAKLLDVAALHKTIVAFTE